MSYACTHSPDCQNERAVDFDMCPPHLNTPRGRQHVLDVITTGNLTKPSDIHQVVQQAVELPEKDIQTHVLEKMGDALDRILDWETESRNRLFRIPEDDWRYMSRERTEQMRSELKVYQDAMDRVMRALATTSKAAMQEKMVSLGRQQSELMIRILLGVITDMHLGGSEQDRAKALLLQRFRDEANLSGRIENKIAKQLEGPRDSQTINGDVYAAEDSTV